MRLKCGRCASAEIQRLNRCRILSSSLIPELKLFYKRIRVSICCFRSIWILIKHAEKAPAFTTFYPANAYTLLGLINLRQDRLNTARTLFKQAIDLENSQNRIKGAAIDYNNLAELALREGSGEEARTYLQQALSYAEMLEDEELKNYLKAKL